MSSGMQIHYGKQEDMDICFLEHLKLWKINCTLDCLQWLGLQSPQRCYVILLSLTLCVEGEVSISRLMEADSHDQLNI